MHRPFMPTEIISIELDAYEKLAAAKKGPRDSFSKVIRRAHFVNCAPTGADLLRHLDKLFSNLSDDGVSLADALVELPDDPPVVTRNISEFARAPDLEVREFKV